MALLACVKFNREITFNIGWFDWSLVIPKDQGCVSYFDRCSSVVLDDMFCTMK